VWAAASELPGIGALNVGGNAQIDDVSCSSFGNCSVIGSYSLTSTVNEAFVATESDGTWGNALALPGYQKLNSGGDTQGGLVISCSAAGNCAVGGSFNDTSGKFHAFVASETNGSWGSAMEVPGTSFGAVLAITCVANGACSAGGQLNDVTGNSQAFVVGEVNGTWGTAVDVNGSAALNAGTSAGVLSISCTSAATCSVGGWYTDAAGNTQAFVDDETDGTWNMASEIPGSQVLNAGGNALVQDISCSDVGSCVVAVNYVDVNGDSKAFIATESNGVWGPGIQLKGTTGAGSAVIINSLACTSIEDCVIGGFTTDITHVAHAFIDTETYGRWNFVAPVLAAPLSLTSDSQVFSVSCSAMATCTGAGYFTDATKSTQVITINEERGVWNNATTLPGSTALNTGGVAYADAISCASDGSCVVGGTYKDSAGNLQAFVDTSGILSVPGAPTIRVASPTKRNISIIVTNILANGSPINYFQYQLNGGEWLNSSSITNPRFTITRLISGTTYLVRIRARNQIGNGVESRAVLIKVK